MSITMSNIGDQAASIETAEFVTANACAIAGNPQLAKKVRFAMQWRMGAYNHILEEGEDAPDEGLTKVEVDAYDKAERALDFQNIK